MNTDDRKEEKEIVGVGLSAMLDNLPQEKSDWEKEFLSVYSKDNDWRPDASPVDVVAFISHLLKSKEEAAYSEAMKTWYEQGKFEGHAQGRLEMLDRVEKAIKIDDGDLLYSTKLLPLLSSLRENEK